MKKQLLAMLVLSSVGGCVLGGEKNKNKVEIFAKVNSGSMRLQYIGKKDIDKCNQFNMKAELNTPCFMYCAYRVYRILKK